jgi:transcriptional regulator with XRE-family HTH domain
MALFPASDMVISMNYIRECLSINLKRQRAFMKFSQEDLAERSGLSAGFIANMETGRSWPSPETLLKLSKALNIDHDKLLADPKSVEIGYTRDEVATIFDRAKEYALGVLPPLESTPRQLLNKDIGRER